MIAEVVIPVPLDNSFYYTVPDNMLLSEGDYVRVPFGNRVVVGIVANLRESIKLDMDLKFIGEKLPLPTVQPAFLKFIKWVSSYNMVPVGMVLKMGFCSMPKFLQKSLANDKKSTFVPIDAPREFGEYVELSQDQSRACDLILERGDGFSVTVLDGETGSGKTEVYCAAIRKLLLDSPDAQILILLPEIVLATQLMKKIHDYFVFHNPVEWHSGLSVKKRKENWQTVIWGATSIVVGARSALFLPFKNLKMIIVDEEHESSYKQDCGIVYNARDMAVVLAKQAEIPIVLCSATPALETIYNVRQGKYYHIVLRSRFGGASLPDVSVVDMRKEKLINAWLSERLQQDMSASITRGEQAMLFLNRRGYARIVLCKKCGHKINCPNCSTWLAEHRMHGVLLCHYCAYSCEIPLQCTSCFSEGVMIPYGIGVEKVAEFVRELIPGVRVAIISSDVGARDINDTIERVLAGEVDVIVGTQIIAKGHNFPKLMLVGVIDADFGLGNSDLRASEKTYQLLHQVAGRSGRFEGRGQVVLQTHDAENAIMKSLMSYNRESFYEMELKSRMLANMPPYIRLISIIVSGKDEQRVMGVAQEVTVYLSKHTVVWGPAPAPLNLVNKMYRYRILIRTHNIIAMRCVLLECKSKYKKLRHIRIAIDVDPMNFI